MAEVLFYQKITPVNKEEHKSHFLKPYDNDYSFARNTPIVPLAASEFFSACRHYPVLFSGDTASLVPVAILGYTEKQNIFINDANQWQKNTYIPAFIRRYPFILANSNDASQLTLCFDDSWKGFNTEGEGEPLFNEQGEEAEYLKKVLGFVESVHQEMQRTRPFVEKLVELELLEKRDLQVTRTEGNSFLLKDFRVINEEAFMKLEDAQVLEFHNKGWLPWVYAHLLSLSNLQTLGQ
ncbi:SapC family protein [Marinospirillum perlucidum]|uniref:SapC family protein n=1 Tax=Marinospirillum perlucidum TaxID=1982602 RepID=UPI000DF26B26|nr:SapC family protein [Marinospirillum perlucidum]